MIREMRTVHTKTRVDCLTTQLEAKAEVVVRTSHYYTRHLGKDDDSSDEEEPPAKRLVGWSRV